MKKITIIIFNIIILLLSCGGNEGSSDFYLQTQSEESYKDLSEVGYNEDSKFDRKLIISANIRINSRDVEKSYRSLEEKLKEYKGYFDNVEASKNRYYITVRIPKENIYNFINFLEENENIENKNIKTEDVTDTYYDTDNRVKNREILLEKLRDYLKEASNIDEVLKVEDRINTLTYEIEKMKGNLKNMQSSIDYSRVNLNISNNEAVRRNTNIYDKYLDLISFFKEFFLNMIFFVIGFTVFAIPIILILALFYYICFGKIGLIKKLYRKIK
ncbi:DUF4349 domain-containing protein [uncultured Brachyspira sp.]|uniref:DUF4349 domain-containing protein n=1 Tax=uncultured Brachyspira sp. TaxID=221953 RepID=UPI0025E122A9|nr:DUF4349 domain-containing protein [uncultured Brachyspira sp.]